MRVIECNECGETISAASNEELVERLHDHLSEEHDQSPDHGDLEHLVEDEAYEATDS